MAARTTPRIRPRLLVAGLVIGFVGFSGAAVLNQAIGRLAALPEDAKPLRFSDAPAPDPAVASAKGEPGEESAPSSPLPTPVMSRAPSLKTYTDSIVRRNIFDSTAVYDPNAQVAQGGGECKEGGAKLLATVVAEPMTFSSALISTGGRESLGQGFSIGDEVSGEGRIVTIEQKRVCLDGGSCLCMGGETGPKKVDGPAAETDDSGVTKLSDTRYAVDQSVLDSAMGNFETLATQLKVYPHKGPDGQIDGYRVSSIKPNSLFSKLGIKNGDIVHGVNGQPLNSTEGAIATYQSLKSARDFSFDITRKNQKQTLEYEVH